MIKRSLKGVWRIAAYTVITLAIVLALLRFTFPYLNRYIPEIEQSLGERLHGQVHIGALKAKWRGYGPVITISQFELAAPDTGNAVLTLKKFHAALDVWRSLLAFKPVMREFELNGLRTTIELDENGRIVLPGLTINNSESDLSADYVIDLLMRQREVAIVDTLITYRRRDGDTVALDLPEMRLRNYADMHQASGDLRVEEGGTAGFVLEFSDYPLQERDKMSLYVESRKLDLARLPFSTQDLGFALDSGTLELKLWADWRNASWRRGEISLALKDVRFSNAEQKHKTVNQLSTHMWLERDKNSEWRLFSDEANLVVDEQAHPAFRVQARIKHQNGGQRWAVDVGQFALAPYIDWLTFSSATPAGLREKLQQWQPQAHIPLLQIDVQTHDNDAIDWAVAAEVQQVHYQPVGLPSLQNFDARFAINRNIAAVRLVNHSGEIHFTDVFRAPIALDTLDVAFNWQTDNEQTVFFAPYVHIANNDIEAVARGRFDLLSGNRENELSLQAQLLRGDIAAKSAYLPVSVMSDNLIAHLDDAARAGTITSAWASIRGPLAHIATNDVRAAFGIEAHAADTTYQFDAAWPLVNQANAHLFFIDDGMRIDVQRAKLLGSTVSASRLTIPHFSSPQLLIEGQLASNGEQAQQLIAASPLREWIAAVANTLSVTGDFNAQLQLAIPLEGEHAARIDGKLQFPGNTLTITPIDLILTQVQGDLNFNEHGLTGGKVRGQGLGGDWQAHVRSDVNGAEIAFNGQLDATVVQDWQFHPLRQRIRGKTAYSGSVEMPYTGNASVHLNTDLAGISVDLPAPYGKPAEEKRAAQFNLAIASEQMDLSAFYGDNVMLEAVQTGDEAWHSELLLHGAEYIGTQSGLTIRGTLPSLHLSSWLSVIASLESSPDHNGGHQDFMSAPRLALTIAKADLFGESFEQLTIDAVGQQTYHIVLQSEHLTGSVDVPTQGPIAIDLQQLNFGKRSEPIDTGVSETSVVPPNDPPLLALTPDDVPALTLRCRKCSVWGYALGEVNAQMTPDVNNKQLRFSAKDNELLDAQFTGMWRLNGGTQLQGTVHSKYFGKLFELWQVSSEMQDTGGTIAMSMQWDGSPFDYSLRRLHLESDIDWGAGYLKMSPNQKNVARFLSLTSLQSLTRRLTLDFRDLYKDGFFYDGIEGHFSLHAGIAHTDKLLIDGTAAAVELSGDANMLLRTLDQRAVINPKIDAFGSIAIGWMINPAVGVLSWLTSKLWAPKVRVVAQMEMGITGSFDNPVVTEGKRIEREIELSDEQQTKLEESQKDK